MKTILVVIGLLICSPALACDSFESCMEWKDGWVYTQGMPERAEQLARYNIVYLKAIAYKLDEISKNRNEIVYLGCADGYFYPVLLPEDRKVSMSRVCND